MRIEVEQSIRIDNTQKDTVLAFSNEISKAVRIPAQVKRKCLKILRNKGIGKKDVYLKLFAAALFILIKNDLDKINAIAIDTEFSDRQNQQFIRITLCKHLQKAGSNLSLDDINFKRIGKKSKAHQKAYNTHQGRTAADYKVKARELLELVQ
ncbi:MAG: hypothetical protein FJ044_04190 [Candidatus Cloacimonetes bacterium]|nr:hypothetical protein [Candidatus Cloacimonadota bacterium]